ncbi:MAG TPA: 16S rRNA (cytosine(967)-C(5))-methyltransferase RsmB [Burkholderiaceae bacterium]|nr:16S rRNA (cytosine(967)-C(5))-methyltransferase RsmB [Burkholderiaceae bacterium]
MAPMPVPVSASAAEGLPRSLPLEQLLHQASTVLAAVRAGRSLDDALLAVPAQARAATQALSFHALRWLGSAQVVRARLAPRTPAPPVDALVCVALALLWPASEPPYAAHTLVDQAVACANRWLPKSAGFVNAVLRRFLRERETLVSSILDQDLVARHNHPRWWIDTVRSEWPQHWQAILAVANQRPPMTLRVNARHGTVSDYLPRLAEAGLSARALGTQAVALDQPCPVGDLPGFEQGDVSVQDASAQLAAPLLLGEGGERLPAGARVLDACAAPGGKTAHLLELADLELWALDRDPARLERVAQTLQRLGGLRAHLLAADAAEPAAWWDGRPFDAVLLDAPCTASGIVRRHPDIRWLRRPQDTTALAQAQRRLLDALWPLVKPGGRLVYATCSVFKAEGERQIEAFLQRQPGAIRRAAPGHVLPLDNPADRAAVVPDGFFYARLDQPF